MASGKLPATLWVAVEGNVESPSEAKEGEERIGERTSANAGGGFGLVKSCHRVPLKCAKQRQRSNLVDTRHVTTTVKFRRDCVVQMHMFS